MVDDHLREESRHGHGEVGLPDDAVGCVGLRRHQRASCCSTCTIAGKPTKTLAHFDRNGFAYLLDRTNGTLISAEKFAPNTNWADQHRPEDGASGRRSRPSAPSRASRSKDICPAAMGGKNQQPASFSPRTKLIYAGINNLCMNYEGVEVQYIAGAPYVGANVRIFAGPGRQPGRVHRVGSRDRPSESGASRNRSRSGPARSSRPATSRSTARWTAGSRR